MADHLQDSLLREIDEDLRQERYAKLWKRYGGYVIAAAVALVVGVAGFKGWQSWDLRTRRAEGEKFAAAMQLEQSGKLEAAQAAFGKLAAESRPGYALLARFQEAALLAKRGDRAGAIAAYREIAADSGVDALYQDLAVLLGTMHEMEGGSPDQLLPRLAPLTAADNPWRYSAKELTGVLELRKGQREKARGLFSSLANDATAPQGVRGRAGEMLAILGK